ncbi:MAG: HD domain-containing protein [Desulfuromonadaceae bacterium]|nr:HD domain-containing protein [Desulfuromonadaceae bacterium]MDD2855181.1 HD domain-containing protein [Desulfuromonadaceae bacterium]
MALSILEKVMKKRGLSSVLATLVSAMETSVIIEDDAGKLLLSTEGAERGVAYPVTASGDLIGWVNGNEKVAAIASLLSQTADSELEKRALVTETLDKYKEITLLYDMVEKVSTSLDTKEVARLVIEEAKKILSLTSVSVLLLNKQTDSLELIAEYGHKPETTTVVRRGVGIAASVWASGRAEIVNDVHSDSRFVSGAVGISSLMCAPLKAKDAVVGVIKLGSDEAVSYSAEDLKLFSTLASLASVAIENAGLYEQLQEAFYTTVYTLAETIEKRDPYTGNHTKRVMEYSLAIGKTLGLSEEDMARLKLGAVLHDIGKIGVRDSVLLKESSLTDDEFEQIKMHPVYGEEILGRISQLKSAIPGVKHHHEKYNGRGYPDGLKGDEIDITARIISVADSFDAMTSTRPYRNGLTLEVAFEELKKYSGTQFDPAMVDAFFASDVMEAFYTASSRQKIII